MILNRKPIQNLLVLVAMDAEERAVTELFSNFQPFDISAKLGIAGKQLKTQNLKIALVNSGIGQVNAGLATALAAEACSADAILLLGVAGALSEELEIGQTILASSIVQHDSYFSGEEGDELMAPGFPFVSVPPERRKAPIFETDLSFQNWLESAHLGLRKGVLLSGSEFVGNFDRKKTISSKVKGSLAVEMEAAAVALVANKLQIPFAVVKTIADRLNPDGTISSDYNQFLKSAADSAAQVISLIVESARNENL